MRVSFFGYYAYNKGMERISVYIDGGNFYHLVIKKLGIEENDFDFEAFAELLIDGRTVSESCKRFYKGSVREKEGDPRSKELMSKQTKLFTTLKKSGWEIKTNKLRTRVEELVVDSRVFEYKKLKKIGLETIHTERMREKGIDVKIATDLLVGAFDNKYDTAIVVSSDSDLVPAIDWVRNRMKKKIEYIGFSIPDLKDPKKSTKPLMMMFSKTNVQRVFSDVEMRKFIKPIPISSKDIVNLYTKLDTLGIKIWIDGGWSVDALLGEQTREHQDLDIAIDQKDLTSLLKFLSVEDYKEIKRDSEYNLVYRDNFGREIDIHAFISDRKGDVIGGIMYPTESLTGSGTINSNTVRCISAEYIVQFLAPWLSKHPHKYVKDISALCEKFNVKYPKEYTDLKKE